MSRRFTLIAGLGSLALALSACGGAEEAPTTEAPEPTTAAAPATVEETETEKPVPTSAEETTSEATAEETASAPAQEYDLPEGVTPPGTELKFGEPATILYTDAVGYTGTIEITVPEPSTGTEADFAGGTTTYQTDASALFVHSTAVGVDDASADLRTVDLSGDLRPFDANNSFLMGAVDFDMPACTSEASLPSPYGPGVELANCDIAWLPEGQEFGGVQFRPWTMPDYENNPVVWTY